MPRFKTAASLIFAGLLALSATATTVIAAEIVYHGSSKSDKYHLRDCKWAQKIAPDNLVIFKTKNAAVAKGYQPCKVCRP